LAQDRKKWRAAVSTIMNIRFRGYVKKTVDTTEFYLEWIGLIWLRTKTNGELL
jgi:hypothetical protein